MHLSDDKKINATSLATTSGKCKKRSLEQKKQNHYVVKWVALDFFRILIVQKQTMGEKFGDKNTETTICQQTRYHSSFKITGTKSKNIPLNPRSCSHFVSYHCISRFYLGNGYCSFIVVYFSKIRYFYSHTHIYTVINCHHTGRVLSYTFKNIIGWSWKHICIHYYGYGHVHKDASKIEKLGGRYIVGRLKIQWLESGKLTFYRVIFLSASIGWWAVQLTDRSRYGGIYTWKPP